MMFKEQKGIKRQTYKRAISYGGVSDGSLIGYGSLGGLLCRAIESKRELSITFVEDFKKERCVSYKDIYQRAKKIRRELNKKGLKKGDFIILSFRNNYEFVPVFWACILGGIIPVPVPAVTSGTLSQKNDAIKKLSNIIELLGNPYFISDSDLGSEKECKCVLGLSNEYFINSLNLELEGSVTDDVEVDISLDDVAFIQFSSGSTGKPKGVTLTHRNLLINLEGIIEGLRGGDEDKYLGWMPYHHDMGLIGFHLTPIAQLVSQINISSFKFLHRPMLWMEKINEHRATITSSPNFGYSYFLDKFKEDVAKDWDLSCIRLIFNGAEPVSAKVMTSFMTALENKGLKQSSMYPVYGMAEACLAVSFPEVDESPRVHVVDRILLAGEGRVKFVSPDHPNAMEVVDLGSAIPGVDIRIVSDKGGVVGEGRIGHIQIRGNNVTEGYLNNDAVNKETYVGNWLRTGDLGFIWNSRLIVTGRAKDIIFVNGQNFFAYDLETCAESEPYVQSGKVAACGWTDPDTQKEKVALFVGIKIPGTTQLNSKDVLKRVGEHINEVMGFPLDYIIAVKRVPKTSSGKVQRYRLLQDFLDGKYEKNAYRFRELIGSAYINTDDDKASLSIVEKISKIWASILEHSADEISTSVSFLKQGGTSIKAIKVMDQLENTFGLELGHEILLRCQTIDEMVEYIEQQLTGSSDSGRKFDQIPYTADSSSSDGEKGDIAVISMACRFPAARTAEEFWQHIRDGRDLVEEVPADRWKADELYDEFNKTDDGVTSRWGAFLEEAYDFDAGFFGISEEEAVAMDPQQRLVMMLCREALDRSGYVERKDNQDKIGVFVGASFNNYMESFLQSFTLSKLKRFDSFNSLNDEDRQRFIDEWHDNFGQPKIEQYTMVDNLLNMISARTSQELNLKGPSFTVDSACSSSLVALHMACESIRRGESDMVLAGGINLLLTSMPYQMFSQSGALSPNGRCKVFDAQADGFVPGEGGGIVLLKPLDKALNDGDIIHGVIKGSWVNNDGRSIGVMSPNPDGQRSVIEETYRRFNLSPEDISYVEAHGTGTVIGDHSEVRALKQVFSSFSDQKHYCALGSVKANVGHLLSAAGIASFFKVLMAMKNKQMPPSINLSRENNSLGLETSPFYLVKALSCWDVEEDKTRCAAINSFGFGGTNCHLVVEQAPPAVPVAENNTEKMPRHLVCLSGNNKEAVERQAAVLGDYLESHQEDRLSDIAYTLNTCRKHYNYRSFLNIGNISELRSGLQNVHAMNSQEACKNPPKVAFMFSGQGAQYPGMGSEMYASNSRFRFHLDEVLAAFDRVSDLPLHDAILNPESSKEVITATKVSQPALFAINYALAKVLLEWSIKPDYMLGHSLGEYVSACVAGVMSLEDAVSIVSVRGQLMSDLPGDGGMLAVFADEADVIPVVSEYLGHLSIAAYNGSHVVVSGEKDALNKVSGYFVKRNVTVKPLSVSHAFHSPLMESMLQPFSDALENIKFHSPVIPVVSNIHATVSKKEKFDRDYWLEHITEPVRFSESLKYIAADAPVVYVDIGPKSTLSALAMNVVGFNDDVSILSTLNPKAKDNQVLLNVVGQLYCLGVNIDWSVIYPESSHALVNLPPYAFKTSTYRITNPPALPDVPVQPKLNHRQWRLLYEHDVNTRLPKGPVLVFCDEGGLYKQVIKKIDTTRNPLVKVFSDDNLICDAEGNHKINRDNADEYVVLIDDLVARNIIPVAVVYLWACDGNVDMLHPVSDGNSIYKNLNHLVIAFQTLASRLIGHNFGLTVVTRGSFGGENEKVSPMARMLSSWIAAACAEKNNIFCKTLDISSNIGNDSNFIDSMYRCVAGEKTSGEYRIKNGELLKSVWTENRAPSLISDVGMISVDDTIVITGGAAGVGYRLAEVIAKQSTVNLVLTGRQPVPDIDSGENSSCTRALNLKKLNRTGCVVHYQDVDVTNAKAMQTFLESVRQKFGRIDGVIHAAGIVDKSNLLAEKKTLSSIRKVLSPKVEGTLYLDHLTRQDNLKFFITLSSVASTESQLGAGLSDYAAANAFLDAYPGFRDADSRTITLNWPLWKGCGMGKEKWIVTAVEQQGIATVTENYGARVFEALLKNATTGTYYIDGGQNHKINKEPVSRIGNAGHQKALPEIKEVVPHVVVPQSDILEVVCRGLSKRLNILFREVITTSNFVDLGVDSAMAVDFVNELSQTLKQPLYPTLLFEYQTPELLADYLRKYVCSSVEQPVIISERNLATNPDQSEAGENDIAIIGMACRFPGAETVDQYWSNLCQAKSHIHDIPQGRWDAESGSDQVPYIKRGGFIDAPYDFEPMFFGISPKEAEAMDPQQRIFLEVAWLALQNSGYVGEESTRNIGVYVGCEHNNYSERFVAYQGVEKLRAQLSDPAMFPRINKKDRELLFDMLVKALSPGGVSSDTVAGNGMNIVAARVNQSLDLTGPALAVNTACSSSLVAMHIACDGLRNGDAEMAIAGGVCLNTSATPYVLLNEAKALSPDGMCAPFDKSANGMVIGEGAGAVILKPLLKAQRDGDMVYAVIKGSAINNDGRSNGITAPKPDGQARAIRAAYEKTGISPESVSYIECHGTATNLGDPVEIQGMSQAFRTYTNKEQFCAVGSVKSAIGHLLSASGIASVIKVASMLKKRIIPPIIGYKEANPYIDFEHSPFYVADTLQPWLAGRKARRAGINAFGFGGTNCHLILEEAPVTNHESCEKPSVVCVSARSDIALRNNVKNLSIFVDNNTNLNVSDVALSLDVGQKHFRRRFAIVTNNQENLKRQLHDILHNIEGETVYKSCAPNKPPKVLLMISDSFNCGINEIDVLKDYVPGLSLNIDEWMNEAQRHFSLQNETGNDEKYSAIYVISLVFIFLGVDVTGIKPESGSDENINILCQLIKNNADLSADNNEDDHDNPVLALQLGSGGADDDKINFSGNVEGMFPDSFPGVLAGLYLKGVNISWENVFSDARRIAVPGYAFDRKNYQARYNGKINLQENVKSDCSDKSGLIPVELIELSVEQKRQSHLRLKKELSRW